MKKWMIYGFLTCVPTLLLGILLKSQTVATSGPLLFSIIMAFKEMEK